jgi:hypothetical protein
MKVPSKSQLYNELREKDKIIESLISERDKEKIEQWEKKIPKAKASFFYQMSLIFPDMVRNVKYEHVDAAGYWFTFQLINDDRIQRYCIRHADIEQ